MKRRTLDGATMKSASKRADTRLLTGAVALFQVAALVLLAFKTQPVDKQALFFALIFPCATFFLTRLLPMIWKLDGLLLSLMCFLCSISVVILQDITKSPTTPMDQALFMAVGLAGMVIGILVARYMKRWKAWTLPAMFAALGAVALPLLIGDWKYGAKNWIELPIGLSVQPSEFGKLALIYVLAACFSRRDSKGYTILALAFAAALCALLLVERDLGALLLYFLTTLAMYFIATSNLPLTLLGLGGGAGAAVVAYNIFDYVKKRVSMWQNPWSDPLDGGHQIIQALIAIGSGGLFGMGLGLGLPRNIPLYHSDFVFAAICEEFGCVFAGCMLAVYLLIIMRGVSIAMSARTSFHGLLAFGIVIELGLQTLLIVAGNTRLIPLTGVTLPFVAAGGSSIVTCMTGMGLLLGISSLNADREAAEIKRAEWRAGGAA